MFQQPQQIDDDMLQQPLQVDADMEEEEAFPIPPPPPQFPLDNDVIILNILRFLHKDQVLKFRRISSIWARAGAVALSEREDGNIRAQLRFEKEKDAKRKLGRLNKLLARTVNPRLFLPPKTGSLSISTACLDSKTNKRNTHSFQVFLKKYGCFLRSLLFQRTVVGRMDQTMFDGCQKVLAKCPYLTTFAFLPHRIRKRVQVQQRLQLPAQAQAQAQAQLQVAQAWTPVNRPQYLERLAPLRLKTFVVQMVHPNYLTTIIRASPQLETLVVLRAENHGRPNDAVLADWTTFCEEMSGRDGMPPGLCSISTLGLQDWDLLPNVPMTSLRTVKLSIRVGLTIMPLLPNQNSPYISDTAPLPQVTTVHVAHTLNAPTMVEAQHLHGYLNRFTNMETLFLDMTPEEGWKIPANDASRILFRGDICNRNTNLKNLFIKRIKIYKVHEEPDSMLPLEFIVQQYPNVEVFHLEVGTLPIRVMGFQPEHNLDAIFSVVQRFQNLKEFAISKIRIWSSEFSVAMHRSDFVSRLERLIVHQDFPPRTLYAELELQEKPKMLSAVLLGRGIPSFQISGFDGQLEGPIVQSVLQREAEEFQNVTYSKFDFAKIFDEGMSLCSSLSESNLMKL